jgi:hypothetical protein
MKNKILLIYLPLILFSCRTTYVEVYYTEKYPVEWTDTLVVSTEMGQDTVLLSIYDTIVVPVYQYTYKKKIKHK